jgi:hypothetical protein
VGNAVKKDTSPENGGALIIFLFFGLQPPAYFY